MSGDRTVLRPGIPRFAINEVAFPRVSATKGYIEPLKISDIQFSPADNQYCYQFLKSHSGDKRKEVHPINLPESELVTLCEAFDLQIPVLERELADMEQKLVENCSGTGELDLKPNTPQPTEDKTKITPPNPRYGHNEVVYLRESAEVTGCLEAFRIDNLRWSNDIGEWLYVFLIRPRPRRNMTVGDRDDMRRSSTIFYPESQLCQLCEATQLAVEFLERAVARARLRKQSLCA